VIAITAFVAEIILLLISAVLLGVGAALTRRPGQAGLMVLAVVSVLLLLTNGPFVVPYLVAPESWTNFILISLLLLGSLVTAVASIAAIRTRERAASSTPRTVAQVAIALAVVLVGVAVAAGITYNAPSAARGDVRLTAKNIKFSRATIHAPAGSVSVFVTNHDTVLHTFTIDQLNVNLNLPANSTARAAFQASPGKYRYVCTLHPDMHGILTVD
jgi:plastocyanin